MSYMNGSPDAIAKKKCYSHVCNTVSITQSNVFLTSFSVLANIWKFLWLKCNWQLKWILFAKDNECAIPEISWFHNILVNFDFLIFIPHFISGCGGFKDEIAEVVWVVALKAKWCYFIVGEWWKKIDWHIFIKQHAVCYREKYLFSIFTVIYQGMEYEW